MAEVKVKKGVNKKSLANLKGQGVISRDVLYKKISRLAPKAIETLDELMGAGHQDSVRMGAAAKVLDKTLPDQRQEAPQVAVQVNNYQDTSSSQKDKYGI